MLRATGVGNDELREILGTIQTAMGDTRELLKADAAVEIVYRFEHQRLASQIQDKFNKGKAQLNSFEDMSALIGADLLRMWDSLVAAAKAGQVKLSRSAADEIRDSMIRVFRVCKKKEFVTHKHNVEKLLSYLLGSVLEVSS